VHVVFQPAATADVEAAYAWYEEQRRGLGGEFRAAIDAAVSTIERTPLAYPVIRRAVRRAVLRRFPYAIFYRVVGDVVVVEACIHGKRHPRVWRSRT
jgi:plasmid stabilization system protein ParE